MSQFLPSESVVHAETESSHHVLGGRALTEYWTLDESPAASIGKIQGIPLNPVGAPSSQTGNFGEAIRINSYTCGLDTGDVAGLALHSSAPFPTNICEFGLCFWIWTTAIITGSAAAFELRFGDGGSGRVEFSGDTNNPSSTPPNFFDIFLQNSILNADSGHIAAYSTGAWHMIAVTGRPDNLYWSLDNSAFAGVSPSIAFLSSATGRVIIGVNGLMTEGDATFGIIDTAFDEVAVLCDDSFTQDDVDFFWNGGAGLTWPAVQAFG